MKSHIIIILGNILGAIFAIFVSQSLHNYERNFVFSIFTFGIILSVICFYANYFLFRKLISFNFKIPKILFSFLFSFAFICIFSVVMSNSSIDMLNPFLQLVIVFILSNITFVLAHLTQVLKTSHN